MNCIAYSTSWQNCECSMGLSSYGSGLRITESEKYTLAWSPPPHGWRSHDPSPVSSHQIPPSPTPPVATHAHADRWTDRKTDSNPHTHTYIHTHRLTSSCMCLTVLCAAWENCISQLKRKTKCRSEANFWGVFFIAYFLIIISKLVSSTLWWARVVKAF